MKVSATVKIPEILDIGAEVTTSAEFTNTIASGYDGLLDSPSCSDTGNSFSTTSNSQVTNTGTFAAPSDKMCKVTVRPDSFAISFPRMTGSLKFDAKSCDVQGHGRVRYLAGGWVWFQYDDKVSCLRRIS